MFLVGYQLAEECCAGRQDLRSRNRSHASSPLVNNAGQSGVEVGIELCKSLVAEVTDMSPVCVVVLVRVQVPYDGDPKIRLSCNCSQQGEFREVSDVAYVPVLHLAY